MGFTIQSKITTNRHKKHKFTVNQIFFSSKCPRSTVSAIPSRNEVCHSHNRIDEIRSGNGTKVVPKINRVRAELGTDVDRMMPSLFLRKINIQKGTVLKLSFLNNLSNIFLYIDRSNSALTITPKMIKRKELLLAF